MENIFVEYIVDGSKRYCTSGFVRNDGKKDSGRVFSSIMPNTEGDLTQQFIMSFFFPVPGLG